MAASVNRSDNNHREKVQKVFIQRDYSEGTNVKFQTKFPPELEGLIDRHLFEQTINTLNRIYAEAEKTSTTTFCEGCLACLTSYVIYLCIETHYQKCLKRISAYLDDQNETVWLPRGLLITDPIERGLRVIEIAILVDSTNLLKMPLLIEGLSPHLTSDIVNQCKNVGIHTVTEFVTNNIEELSQKTNIPYKKLVHIRHNLLANYGGFPQRADSLYAILLETMHIISTGSKRIDAFLKGGIYTGEVTELHGSPGSGKSQFCLSVSANLIFDSKSTVLYLDSNCNFAASRLEQILIGKCEDTSVVAEKLQKVRVVKLRDIYNLFDVLDLINCELQSMEKDFFKHLKLIVIDSITTLLSPCFGGKYLDGPGFMGNLSYLFKMICTEHMISILVSNNTVQSANCDIKPGLGPSWKYLPSVSLCIRKLKESKIRKLTAIKSCRNCLHNETSFGITEAGVSD